MPYSSPSPLQPTLLKPFWVSSIFLTYLLQRNKLLPTSVAIMCTLGRNRKSRKDGENTCWEQPCCVHWEKQGVCKHTEQTRTLIWRGVCNFFLGIFCLQMCMHTPMLTAMHVSIICVCMTERRKEQYSSARVSSGCLKDMKPLVSGRFVCLCVFQSNSFGEIKK